MNTKLLNNNSKDLIIFLTGWGCDDIQFKSMTSTKDVLLCWDYSDLNFSFDFSKYENIYLLTYSAGVYVAGLIQDKLPNLKYKIAINGNPLMFDSYYGISDDILKLMYELDLENYMQFRKDYLVYSVNELEFFNNNASVRSFESCADELKKLEQYYSADKIKPVEYDIAILSDNDKIFNPKHQMEYFKGKYKLLKNHAHNVFATFRTYDEIFNYINMN